EPSVVPRYLRPYYQGPWRSGRTRLAPVRPCDHRRRRQPEEKPAVPAGATCGAGPRGHQTSAQCGSGRLLDAAGALCQGKERQCVPAWPACGLGLRIRVPTGQHEPPVGAGRRKPVPDAVGALLLHFLDPGARNCGVGRRYHQVRPPGRGRCVDPALQEI
ncbi:Phosphopantetheine adenylyltransferase (EC 2.7.7.3), partial [Pseudomonas sp. FG-3G]